jgi:hypothetical protein
MQALSDEDKDLIDIESLQKGNLAQAVLDIAREQQKKCEGKQWRFSFKGHQIAVRDVLKRIISWTEKFRGVVDFAVSMDVSGHAALPWACIKFCLVVSAQSVLPPDEQAGKLMRH